MPPVVITQRRLTLPARSDRSGAAFRNRWGTVSKEVGHRYDREPKSAPLPVETAPHFVRNCAPLPVGISAPFRPESAFAQFLRAANITIASNPPGLKVLADDTAVVGNDDSGVRMEWGLGTTHTLGVVSPQFDTHGRVWVFSSWSDGGRAGIRIAFRLQLRRSP